MPRELFQPAPPPEPAAPPCGICGATSICAVWDIPLCAVDYGAWIREPSVTAGAIGLDRPVEEFVRCARAATEAWAQTRKARAA